MTLVRAVAVTVLVTACAAAQDRVPPLRALREMEVTGTAAFDRDQVACALVADEPTLRALRQPLDDDVATTVAERIEDLYRRGGYADAMARGGVVGGKLRVELHAGRRYRCGDVRCTGNSVLKTEQIRTALAGKQVEWVPGAFARLGHSSQRRAVAEVSRAYQKIGRYGSDAKVTFARDGENIVLDVDVLDEGSEVRIQSLLLEGEDEAHRAAVLAAVQFTPGTLATHAAVDALRREFEQTGRYARVRLDRPKEPSAVLDPLKVIVKVRPGAEALDRVAARDAAQLRTAFDLELARLHEGVPIQVTLAIPAERRWGSFRLQPGRVVFALGKDGLAATAEHVVVGNGSPVRAAVFLTSDELTCAFGERVWRWTFDRPIGVEIQLTSTLDEHGGDVRWGLGLGTGLAQMMAIEVHAGMAAYLLTLASEVRRNGDELSLRFGDTRVRLAATGEVVGDRVQLDGDDQCSIALRSAPIADQRRAASLHATAKQPTSEAASILLDMIATIVADAMTPAATADVRVPVLLRSWAGPFALPESRAPSKEPVPELASDDPSLAAGVAMIAAIPAVDRSFQGRLVDLSAAFVSLLQGDAKVASAAFEAITANKAHGPVSLSIVALLLQVAGNEHASASFAKAAAERLGFDAFYADAADFGANVSGLAVIPPQIGARWRAQAELREMFADLPAGEAGDLAAWRKGLELLWKNGGEQLLRDALAK